MSEVTMTMQEALAKKKILESDIAKRLSSNSLYGNKIYYVSYATETAKTIKGVDRDEFEDVDRSMSYKLINNENQ